MQSATEDPTKPERARSIEMEEVPHALYKKYICHMKSEFQLRILLATFPEDKYPRHVIQSLGYLPSSQLIIGEESAVVTDKQEAWRLYYKVQGDEVFGAKLKLFHKVMQMQALIGHWNGLMHRSTNQRFNKFVKTTRDLAKETLS